MGCKCNVVEIVLAVIILVVTLWPGIVGSTASPWVVIVAAVLLLIHALACKACKGCEAPMASGKKKK